MNNYISLEHYNVFIEDYYLNITLFGLLMSYFVFAQLEIFFLSFPRKQSLGDNLYEMQTFF